MIKADTKKILISSFEELVKERALDSITVQDIVQNCGASRTTFYYHFKDKYDLMLWEFKKHTEKKEKCAEDLSLEEAILSALHFFLENRDYYSKIAAYEGQNSLSEFCNIYGINAFQAIFSRNLRETNLPEELVYSIKYFCSGSTFINMEWIKSGMTEQPDKIALFIINNIPDPILEFWPKH